MPKSFRKIIAGAATVFGLAAVVALAPTAAHAESSFPTGQMVCPVGQVVVMNFTYTNITAPAYIFWGTTSSNWHGSPKAVMSTPGTHGYNTGLNMAWGGIRYSGDLTWWKSCSSAVRIAQ